VGADKDREVYWRGAAQAITMRAEVTVLLGNLYVETLAATAFTLSLRVLELKSLVQPLLDEIDQGPIDQGQTLRVNHHFDASHLENGVFRIDLIGVIHHVGEARTTGFLDPDSQTDANSALRQMSPDPVGRRFRQ
jgi:hypothetical protein